MPHFAPAPDPVLVFPLTPPAVPPTLPEPTPVPAAPAVVEADVPIAYAAVSTNLHTPCATHVFPDGTVDVDAIVGNVPLLIVALNINESAALGFSIPVIFYFQLINLDL